MKQYKSVWILVTILLSIYFAAYGIKIPAPPIVSGLIHSTMSQLGFAESGHTGFAKDVGSNTVSFNAQNVYASGSGYFDGDVRVGGSLLASVGSIVGTHNGLTNLEYSVSGHTGFASSGAIPRNASFTLNGLAEKDFDNLTNKPTSASYSYALSGLTEKNYNNLDGKPTSASWTHSGLLGLAADDHGQYLNLDGRTSAGQIVSGPVVINGTGGIGLFKVDSASASFNGVPFAAAETNHANLFNLGFSASGHTGFASSASIPGNGSFTLAGLSEKNFNNLDGKPTSASYSYAYNIGSLTDCPDVSSNTAGKVLGRNAANTAWEMNYATGTQLVPTGTIIEGLWVAAPAGYLMCDGSPYATSTYSNLFAILASSTLPDLRGRYVVGAGTAPMGSDYNKTLGATALDKMQTHTHLIYTRDGGASMYSINAAGDFYINTGRANPSQLMDTQSGRTGNITEPANYALNRAIKY
jgi:hypothetical protein